MSEVFTSTHLESFKAIVNSILKTENISFEYTVKPQSVYNAQKYIQDEIKSQAQIYAGEKYAIEFVGVDLLRKNQGIKGSTGVGYQCVIFNSFVFLDKCNMFFEIKLKEKGVTKSKNIEQQMN